MEFVLFFSVALVVSVNAADERPSTYADTWDDITAINMKANLIGGKDQKVTFGGGDCVVMVGHCHGDDNKPANLSYVIPIKTRLPLVCKKECQKHEDIGGCEFKRSKDRHGNLKHTCTKYYGFVDRADGDKDVKCWNMLKCSTADKFVMFEGDIIRTRNVEYVAGSGKFDAIKGESRKWPGGRIPYTFGRGFSSQGRKRVQWAIAHIAKHTCVRWVPRANERAYVYIFNAGGCFSMIGRTGYGQRLSLGRGCLYDSGTAVHEMMHAMGWFHEQSRNDRDRYISINWGNIEPNMRYNFEKYGKKADTYGITYDKKSVMQYGNKAFGRGRVTMIDRQSPGAKLGQRQGMTADDIKSINKHYGCKKTGDDKKDKKDKEDKKETKKTKKTAPCGDTQTFCPLLKKADLCGSHSWVQAHCKKTCDRCPTLPPPSVLCVDKEKKHCPAWAKKGYCKGRYARYMKKNCTKACGSC